VRAKQNEITRFGEDDDRGPGAARGVDEGETHGPLQHPPIRGFESLDAHRLDA
jgi:hypothetical protein